MTKLILIIVAILAMAIPSAASASSHRCAGSLKWTFSSNTPNDSTLVVDQIRAQRGTSCRYARYLVRVFERAQLNNSDCSTAAQTPGYACTIIHGQYECSTAERTAYCMDQGRGVKFRQRAYVPQDGE